MCQIVKANPLYFLFVVFPAYNAEIDDILFLRKAEFVSDAIFF